MRVSETHDTVPAPSPGPNRDATKLSAAQGREPGAVNGRNTTTWPPARYRPGSPLHWDYPVATDSE
jgi:hypothetical protein